MSLSMDERDAQFKIYWPNSPGPDSIDEYRSAKRAWDSAWHTLQADLDAKDAEIKTLKARVAGLEEERKLLAQSSGAWHSQLQTAKQWVAELEGENSIQRLRIITLDVELTVLRNSINYRTETTSG